MGKASCGKGGMIMRAHMEKLLRKKPLGMRDGEGKDPTEIGKNSGKNFLKIGF